MKLRSTTLFLILGAAMTAWLGTGSAPARGGDFAPPPRTENDNAPPPFLKDIGIDQKLGDQIPLDLTFTDEEGQSVRFADLLKGRPVVLSLVYFECPGICTAVLNDQMRSYSALPLEMGKDYDVISISFDARETPALAAAKKREYVRKFGRDGIARHWRFITGPQASIDAITGAVGFRYKWDEATRQFVHPAGVFILMPDGRIARYFFGIDYEPRDLRFSLIEAGQGKVGSLSDKILLYCFHYDPTSGKYGWAVARALKIGGAVTIVGLVGGITLLLRKERQIQRQAAGDTTPAGADARESGGDAR